MIKKQQQQHNLLNNKKTTPPSQKGLIRVVNILATRPHEHIEALVLGCPAPQCFLGAVVAAALACMVCAERAKKIGSDEGHQWAGLCSRKTSTALRSTRTHATLPSTLAYCAGTKNRSTCACCARLRVRHKPLDLPTEQAALCAGRHHVLCVVKGGNGHQYKCMMCHFVFKLNSCSALQKSNTQQPRAHRHEQLHPP